VAYLDAAVERVTADGRARFTEAVEAVRTGYIFARDQKAYDRWSSDIALRSGRPPTGKPLAQLARDLGGQTDGLQVVRGQFEFRN
jgi:hypothetical protein